MFLFLLAILLILSILPLGDFAINSNAATTINYSPNPKVEYNYASSVSVGTIRYIAQTPGASHFNWNYWPAPFGEYYGPGGECGTASISMALSYIGVNKTPKDILHPNSGGYTVFTGWGVPTSSPSIATGMNNYINGNSKYSPLIVHFTEGYDPTWGHWVVLIGKVSESSYLVLDPGASSTWILTTSDYRYASINQTYQYFNQNASIVHAEPTNILYPTSGGVYKIASGVGNNMYLDFALSSNNVQIYENCDGHSAPAFVKSQYYKITHIGDGWHSIINIGNGMAVDVDGGNSASGTNMHQWAYIAIIS